MMRTPEAEKQTTQKFSKSHKTSLTLVPVDIFVGPVSCWGVSLKGSGSNSWGRKVESVLMSLVLDGLGAEQRVSCNVSHLWNGPKGGCWRTSWWSDNAWDTLSLTSLTWDTAKGTALGSISPGSATIPASNETDKTAGTLMSTALMEWKEEIEYKLVKVSLW